MMLKKDLIPNLDKIKFFNEIDKLTIDKIIGDCQLIKIPKGKLLFTQEQIAKFFYVVIEGSISLTYLNQDGEELMVEISEIGDFLNDIFMENFLVNAKSINASQVIAIDRLKIIDLITNNHSFAINFLNKNSQRNNKIFLHLIELKSNNGKFKLVNFLLGIFFDQGQKNKQVLLKYNKSLIASYLGIKPETFSRILKKLTSEGEIAIKKNLITFLKIETLCKYCNLKTSEKCQDKKCRDEKNPDNKNPDNKNF